MSAYLNRLQEVVQSRRNQVWLSVIIIIGLIIRLPRVGGIIGSDAFIVLWMGNAIAEGALSNWTITPFSILGMYPFASYPIGIPALLAGLFQIGVNFEGTVLFISMGSSILGTIGAYRLGEYLFRDTDNGLIFAAFYSFSQIFLRFTYFTVSTRGPFMALLPFLTYYGLKYVRSGGRMNLLKITALLIVFMFIHPLGFFLILYPLVILAFFITRSGRRLFLESRLGINGTNNPELRSWNRPAVRSFYNLTRKIAYGLRKIDIVLYLGLIMVAFIVGLMLLPFDEGKTTPFILTNDTIVGKAMNLVIDYGIRLGILSIFLPIGILFCFKESNYSESKFLHLLFGLLLTFTIPTSLYTSVVLFPLFAYYSVAGFILVKKWLPNTVIVGVLLVFLTLFSNLYNLYVVILPTWILLSVAFLAVMFPITIIVFYVTRRFIEQPVKFRMRVNTGFIVLIVVVFSLLCTEGMLLQGTRSDVSVDEIAIIDIIKTDPESSLVFVPALDIGRRLQSYMIPAIGAFNEDASLYFGWIGPAEIIAYSHFDIGSIFSTGKPFTYDGRRPEREFFNSMVGLDLTVMIDYVSAYDLGLRYVIVQKDANGFSDIFHSASGDLVSILLQTAPMACEIIFEGDEMALFHLV